MKIHEECLPCLVNQAIRTAQMLQLEDRESLYQKIFQHMSRMDFSRTNPEIIGENFRLIKAHCRCDDPYRETKAFYNRRFLQQMPYFEEKITFIQICAAPETAVSFRGRFPDPSTPDGSPEPPYDCNVCLPADGCWRRKPCRRIFRR